MKLIISFILILAISGWGMATRVEAVSEIEFWTINLQPTFNDYFNRMIEQYESENIGVKIVWKDLPFAAIQQKLLSSMAGGVSPDVVNLSTEMTRPLIEKKALVAIDQINPNFADTYFAGIWQAGEYHGHVYAFPWYVSTKVIMYNQEIFAAAGLDPEKPPKTMDDIKEFSRQIKDKTGINGFIPHIRMYNEFVSHGIPLFSDEEQREVAFNTKEAVAVVQWYLDLINEDIITIEDIRGGYNEAIQRYMSGNLGMLITGPQFLSRIKTNAPDIYENTRVAHLPLGKAKVINAAAMNVVIPKTSKNPQEAADFAYFITGDYAQLEFSKIVNILPSAIKAAQDDFFTAGDNTPEGIARRISAEQLQWARDMTITAKNSSKLIKAIDEEFEKAYYGKITAEEAVANMAGRWEEILSK